MKNNRIVKRNFVPFGWWRSKYKRNLPFETKTFMNTQDKKIFIVEDSPTISGILKKVISNVEHAEAQDFLSGEEMLEQLEKQEPSLIFLDYFLDTQKKGYMNGEEVFYKLKTDHPEIPVVMLTGMTDEAKLKKLNEVGFDKIIHKDHDQLFEEVQECVKKYTD